MQQRAIRLSARSGACCERAPPNILKMEKTEDSFPDCRMHTDRLATY